jgi:phosphoglycolate/pyridoxal phosphate phosphatase family enzyme
MQVYVFDLDGVLYRMDEPVPGAQETIERLKADGTRVYYLTNNSSKTRADYACKLATFGIPATEDEFMTSAYALGQWFVERGEIGKSVYVIGEEGLKNELMAAGMKVIEYSETHDPKFVVSGWDREFTYTKLAHAQQYVQRGAVFIATNRDATYPDSGGRTLPGSGALVAALQTCTSVVPIVIGKPEPYTLELILRHAGASSGECTIIGDRIDTDIAIGKRVGARTVLVLTGVHTQADVDKADPLVRPDRVLPDLTYLISSRPDRT